MARSWAELLGDADGAAGARRGAAGLLRAAARLAGEAPAALTEQIAAAAFDPDDDEAWERLEEALIAADVGVRATAELVRRLEARASSATSTSALAEEIAALLGEPPTLDVPSRADGDPRRRRQRHRQDDDDRQARVAARRARPLRPARRRRHVPRRRRGAARDLGAARGRGLRRRRARRRSRRGRLRRHRGGARARARRRHRRYRRAACTRRPT